MKLASSSNSIDQIADYLRIGRNNFRKILKRQPEVLIEYYSERAKAGFLVASKLYEKALDGDTTCMIFILKTQAGWSENGNPVDFTTSPIKLPSINLIVNKSDNIKNDNYDKDSASAII